MSTVMSLESKKILNIKEFQAYTTLGRNGAYKLAHESGAAFRVGKRILINRDAFDRYIDGKTC